MPDIHASSASASDRLIHCPPSLMLGEQYGRRIPAVNTAEKGQKPMLVEFLLKEPLVFPVRTLVLL